MSSSSAIPTPSADTSIPKLIDDSILADGVQTARPELNELVDQAIIFQKSFVHEDAQFHCELSDEDLYIDADGEKVTEALFLLLESTINALIHMPHDLVTSKRLVIRTGSVRDKGVFLTIQSQRIPAFDHQNDIVWGGPYVANLVLRQGQASAEGILHSIGGTMAVDSPQSASAHCLTIRVDLPRWTSGENRVNAQT